VTVQVDQAQITDHKGTSSTFAIEPHSGRTNSVTLPNGRQITYGYDNDRPAYRCDVFERRSATDQALQLQRIGLVPAGASLPDALTGVTDELGNRFAFVWLRPGRVGHEH